MLARRTARPLLGIKDEEIGRFSRSAARVLGVHFVMARIIYYLQFAQHDARATNRKTSWKDPLL